MPDRDEILGQAADWLSAGKEVALATVIDTWGSSPRPVGSQLAVDNDGTFVGSVSGGCIEGAVIEEAMGSISDGQTRVLDFGVTNEQAIETRKKQYLSEQTTAGPGKETVVFPGESGGVTCEQA